MRIYACEMGTEFCNTAVGTASPVCQAVHFSNLAIDEEEIPENTSPFLALHCVLRVKQVIEIIRGCRA